MFFLGRNRIDQCGYTPSLPGNPIKFAYSIVYYLRITIWHSKAVQLLLSLLSSIVGKLNVVNPGYAYDKHINLQLCRCTFCVHCSSARTPVCSCHSSVLTDRPVSTVSSLQFRDGSAEILFRHLFLLLRGTLYICQRKIHLSRLTFVHDEFEGFSYR